MVASPLNISGCHLGRFCLAKFATSCWLDAADVSRGVLEKTTWDGMNPS